MTESSFRTQVQAAFANTHEYSVYEDIGGVEPGQNHFDNGYDLSAADLELVSGLARELATALKEQDAESVRTLVGAETLHMSDERALAHGLRQLSRLAAQAGDRADDEQALVDLILPEAQVEGPFGPPAADAVEVNQASRANFQSLQAQTNTLLAGLVPPNRAE